MKFYSQIMEDARKHGVTICLENMWNRRDGGAIFDSACSDPYEACDYIDTLNDMAGEELFDMPVAWQTDPEVTGNG